VKRAEPLPMVDMAICRGHTVVRYASERRCRYRKRGELKHQERAKGFSQFVVPLLRYFYFILLQTFCQFGAGVQHA
jgi:hypothetical protein